ncbi:MAG: hypothetical protein MOP51_602 [Citricoccus sp.]|jgi:uncharacterized membrane-anchored protein YjiN (DUF445 family)|nr:hypothetical protein [Citricoccus sp. WCRC_4]
MDQNLPDAGLPTSAPGPARAQHRADVAPGPAVMPGPAGTGEAEREAALKRMKLVATGLLVVMAVIFVVAFALQESYPWLAYVRAAAEGGMVGALADWFAVTALFRHPMGLRIPHTAIIPRKKDTIGESLGAFVQENFLAGDVAREKLEGLRVADRAGAWLRQRPNAERVAREVSATAEGILDALDDVLVRDVLAGLVQRHMVEPDWSPTLSTVLGKVVSERHHDRVVDLVVARTGDWVARNPEFFLRSVRRRSPQWVPEVVDQLLAERIHAEALKYLASVRAEPQHELRRSVDQWLDELVRDMREDPLTRDRVEQAKRDLFNDPRMREWAGQAWATTKEALLVQLRDPASDLHQAMVAALQDLGGRLQEDPALADRVDGWASDAAQHLARAYGPEVVGVIGETIQRWDGRQASRTIELYMGKDLQYIRINGSIVGALAGLAIYTVAHAVFG